MSRRRSDKLPRDLNETLRTTIARCERLETQLTNRTSELHAANGELEAIKARASSQDWVKGPIPLILHCPECHQRHVDEGEFATKVHTSHSCQHCGLTWRPAIVATVGVRFLPGCKNP